MENTKSIESFSTDLSSGLLYAANTNEIDIVVDLFLEKICKYYNFDCGEVYFPKGEYLILRGVYGIDRYYVCKIDFPVSMEYIHNVLYNGQKYTGKNVNLSDAEVFSNYETFFVLPITLCQKHIGIIIFRNREDKTEFYERISNELQNFIRHFAVYANNVLQSAIYKEKDRQLRFLRELYLRLSDVDKFETNLKDLASDMANIFGASKTFIRLRYEGYNFETISSYGFDSHFDIRFLRKKNTSINIWIEKSVM